MNLAGLCQSQPPGHNPVAGTRRRLVRPFVLALVMMIVNGGTSLANDNLSSMNSADTVDISNPVDLRDGRLSVSENNLSLVELMQLVGAEANFNVVAYGDLEGKTGSWSFSDLALIEAVRKLLRDTSTIIIYRPGNDSDVEPEISTVYLLGSNSAKVDPIRITTIETGLDNQLRLDQAQVDDVQNRLADIDRSEGLTDEITLGNLAFALRHDPDPEVRIRAVSALDGIGSKAAVTALEGGLGDLDASVRKKVTLAFGKINDERIPLWLGQILMGDPSAEVRLVAVQSIAQKEGDIARIFLEAATGDSSSMVSEAALQLTR